MLRFPQWGGLCAEWWCSVGTKLIRILLSFLLLPSRSRVTLPTSSFPSATPGTCLVPCTVIQSQPSIFLWWFNHNHNDLAKLSPLSFKRSQLTPWFHTQCNILLPSPPVNYPADLTSKHIAVFYSLDIKILLTSAQSVKPVLVASSQRCLPQPGAWIFWVTMQPHTHSQLLERTEVKSKTKKTTLYCF